MKRIKVTYILSNIDKSVAFEWIAEQLNKSRFELSFIHLHSEEPYLHRWLQEKKINSVYIHHIGKKSYPRSFLKVWNTLKKTRPDVVHSHLIDANLIGLSAAKLFGIKKRIYTRHHSTFHHDFFPKAVKWDKISNYLATDIIAISENVKNVLLNKENVASKKIHLIHHGFDLEAFQRVSQERVNELKRKYHIPDSHKPIIGVISRYTYWKGIQYIIPAFKEYLKKYPDALLILANAVGSEKNYIQQLLIENIPSKNYIEITFEHDLFALYRLFDIYVHTPVNKEIEAFGQTYVEAIAAGIPSVFTLSGVASEFIKNNENALVVEYKNSNEIVSALLKITEESLLRERLILNGKDSVKPFRLTLFIQKLEVLYA